MRGTRNTSSTVIVVKGLVRYHCSPCLSCHSSHACLVTLKPHVAAAASHTTKCRSSCRLLDKSSPPGQVPLTSAVARIRPNTPVAQVQRLCCPALASAYCTRNFCTYLGGMPTFAPHSKLLTEAAQQFGPCLVQSVFQQEFVWEQHAAPKLAMQCTAQL